jgi:hypothetical protein
MQNNCHLPKKVPWKLRKKCMGRSSPKQKKKQNEGAMKKEKVSLPPSPLSFSSYKIQV